jgi:phosphoglycolate phosphatase-like HAD superfamily hydrolase
VRSITFRLQWQIFLKNCKQQSQAYAAILPMLRLITDFDGPVMDVSERYYRVYQFCLAEIRRPEQATTTLSKSDFWNMKRARVPEREIGLASGLEAEQSRQFAHLRRDTVHTLPYLQYDQPVPGAIAALERIQSLGWDLVVMTMRRDRELNAAFEQYNLGRFFATDRRYCLPDDYVKTRDIDDKPKLMGRAQTELPAAQEAWMVGDTEADIAAARSGHLPAIGVLSGIRDRDRLAAHHPTTIVANLNAAIDHVLAQALIAPDRAS